MPKNQKKKGRTRTRKLAKNGKMRKFLYIIFPNTRKFLYSKMSPFPTHTYTRFYIYINSFTLNDKESREEN